jgi:hypothetical protein
MSACGPCGFEQATYSARLGTMVCGHCYFGSVPEAEREESNRAWARKDLAGQVRAAARRLEGDPRSQRLRDAALDLELAADDTAAVAPLRDAQRTGLKVTLR